MSYPDTNTVSTSLICISIVAFPNGTCCCFWLLPWITPWKCRRELWKRGHWTTEYRGFWGFLVCKLTHKLIKCSLKISQLACALVNCLGSTIQSRVYKTWSPILLLGRKRSNYIWLQVRLEPCLAFVHSHEDWKFNFAFGFSGNHRALGVESWEENASSWETCNKLARTSNAIWRGARVIGGSVWRGKAEGREDTSLIQRDPSSPAQLFLFVVVHIFLVSSYLPAWCHGVPICTVRKTCLCCTLNHFPRQKYRGSFWEQGLKFLQRTQKLNIWNAAKGILEMYLSLSPPANYSSGRRFCILLDLVKSFLFLHSPTNIFPDLVMDLGKGNFINVHMHLRSSLHST